MAETNNPNFSENVTIPQSLGISQNGTITYPGNLNSNATLPQFSDIPHKKPQKEFSDDYPLLGIGVGIFVLIAIVSFAVFGFSKKKSKTNQKEKESDSDIRLQSKFSENDRRLLKLMTDLNKLIKST